MHSQRHLQNMMRHREKKWKVWMRAGSERKVKMLIIKRIKKILQARLQQYMDRELPDVQAGFRKGRGTRDQIANIRWIIKKARVPEKHLFLLY